jgi:hypothetical protein
MPRTKRLALLPREFQRQNCGRGVEVEQSLELEGEPPE